MGYSTYNYWCDYMVRIYFVGFTTYWAHKTYTLHTQSIMQETRFYVFNKTLMVITLHTTTNIHNSFLNQLWKL